MPTSLSRGALHREGRHRELVRVGVPVVVRQQVWLTIPVQWCHETWGSSLDWDQPKQTSGVVAKSWPVMSNVYPVCRHQGAPSVQW